MTVREVCISNGYYVGYVQGNSMRPMLRPARDSVMITCKKHRARRYDVIAFSHQNGIILHRVIRSVPGGYITRGDNCMNSERVNEDDAFGVLEAFWRKKRRFPVACMNYKCYSRVIVWIHPLVVCYHLLQAQNKKDLCFCG